MNAPDRFELLELAEGAKKVTYSKDTKIQNAGAFTLQKEDHTLGNIVRMDPNVMFAGYRMPHPLDHCIVVKIQTTSASSPQQALETALGDLINEINLLEDKFKSEVQRKITPAQEYY